MLQEPKRPIKPNLIRRMLGMVRSVKPKAEVAVGAKRAALGVEALAAAAGTRPADRRDRRSTGCGQHPSGSGDTPGGAAGSGRGVGQAFGR